MALRTPVLGSLRNSFLPQSLTTHLRGMHMAYNAQDKHFPIARTRRFSSSTIKKIPTISEAIREDAQSYKSHSVRDMMSLGNKTTVITEMDKLENTFNKVSNGFGGVDNCITCAGIVIDKPFLEHEWEESARILTTNVMGSLFTAQLAAKAMREKGNGGSIALIASSASYGPTPSRCMAVYSASKGAIRTAVQSLAVELAPYGIRVNSISPGFMSTEMVFETALKKPELWSTINETPLLKRIGYSGDLKGIVGFLLSDASAYTTGIDILCDAASPSCTKCSNAGVPCVALSASKQGTAPRSIVQFLETELAAIRRTQNRPLQSSTASARNSFIDDVIKDFTPSFMGLTASIPLLQCTVAGTRLPSASSPGTFDLSGQEKGLPVEAQAGATQLADIPTSVADFLLENYVKRVAILYPIYHLQDIVGFFNSV
ncbi:hypothetical protein BJX65DRAFT_315211 [Aspergillus insuetus]